MAPEAPVETGEQSEGTFPPAQNLPVPYRDPFEALGQDLQAVLATLRLRAQELWRRNRQGDLSVPGFWPQDLAPSFWPAVLGLALAALVAVPIGITRMVNRQSAPAPEQPEILLTTPLPQARLTDEPQPLAPALPLPLAEQPVAPPAEPEPEPEPPAEPEPARLQLDPLMQLLQNDDPRHLIASVRPQPATGVLELELSPGFARLPEPERRSDADRWLERSRELGYEQLLLVDGMGRPLGRQALVGSGMILLDVSAPS
jgi:hypothetical protein